MAWLKKEYRGKINQIIPVGWRSGRKIYCVQYVDWTEEEMTEDEVNNLFLGKVRWPT